jgi:hypothetical protein
LLKKKIRKQFLSFFRKLTVIKAAPKHVEKVAVGSLIPRSVPATFAVYPDMKWYIASPGLNFATGGRTPKASQERKMMLFGCPAICSLSCQDREKYK